MENNGKVNLMLVLSQASSATFQVRINTMDVTAISRQMASNVTYLQMNCIFIMLLDREDYSGNLLTINIPVGVTMQPLAINITDNDVVECIKSFIISISVTSYSCGVTIGNNNRSVVTIKDDDGKANVLYFCTYVMLILLNKRSNSIIESIAIFSSRK